MPLIKFKPRTPGTRFKSLPDFQELTTDKPYKPLTIPRKNTGGRNNYGRITSRHRGGGHKRRIRLVDFKRLKHDVSATVLTIEYDPNRSARIALIEYSDGQKSYILAPSKLQVGATVMSGEKAEIEVGNHIPLALIPPGTQIFNIEYLPGQGGKMVRSAGGVAQILAKQDKFVNIKLPSGEVRMIPSGCYATIGQCSNPEHGNVSWGKAGRSRWKGIRPQTRGRAMNPVDHPLGGGEGKTAGGRHPCSPWGQKAKGLKTRRRSKSSNRFIVQRRNSKKGR